MTHFLNFEISVRDYGFGMSQETLEKLFIDFTKIDENR